MEYRIFHRGHPCGHLKVRHAGVMSLELHAQPRDRDLLFDKAIMLKEWLQRQGYELLGNGKEKKPEHVLPGNVKERRQNNGFKRVC